MTNGQYFNESCRRLTWEDVLLQYSDVVVAVAADLLMVEAEGMEQFMLHCAMKDAALLLEGQLLLSSLTAQERPAPASTCSHTIQSMSYPNIPALILLGSYL